MRGCFMTLAAVWLAVAPPCFAKPLDPALQQQLLGIYDSYNHAIAVGKLPDALAFRSAAIRAEIQKEVKTAKDRQSFMAMSQAMVPDKIEVRHASIDTAGDHAHLLLLVVKTFPPGKAVPGAPPPGSTQRGEVTLNFVKQGTGWVFDDQVFGIDPATIVACKDVRFEPASAYDQHKSVSLGGPIVRVDFQPDYTMVVVRVVDEENCAFMPSRAELLKHGLDPAKLVPYAIVDIEGSPHQSDKQKILVENLTVQQED
jgi:hypothetical protein